MPKRTELLRAIDDWLAEAKSKITMSPNPVKVEHGVESWQVNSDGSFERLCSWHRLSPEFLKDVFENSAAWTRVKSLALEREKITANLDDETWWSFSSRGPEELEVLFSHLLPVPTVFGDQYIYNSAPASIATEFLNSLEAETFESVIIWPIRGIEVYAPLDLADDLQFRALTQHEKLQILRQGLIRLNLRTRITEDCCQWYGLCLVERGNKRLNSNRVETRLGWQEQISLVEDFMAALSFATGLNLRHAGGLYVPPSVRLSGLGTFVTSLWHDSTANDPLWGSFTLPFRDPALSKEQEQDLLNAWKILRPPKRIDQSTAVAGESFSEQEARQRKTKQKGSSKEKPDAQKEKDKIDKFNSSMAIVIRRLHYALTRSRAEDQLIDLMIAAEVLYGGDGNRDKTFRLSTNAAILAEGKCSDRLNIYDEFKAAYSFRSKIVHGDEFDQSKAERAASDLSARVRGFANTLLRDKQLASRWPNWIPY